MVLCGRNAVQIHQIGGIDLVELRGRLELVGEVRARHEVLLALSLAVAPWRF